MSKKILITGGQGVTGRNLTKCFLSKYSDYKIYSPGKDQLNLLNNEDLKHAIQLFSPDVIIHSAIQGGRRIKTDGYDIIKNNVEMYEHLIATVPSKIPIILFASGAEFDRRKNITLVKEEDVHFRYPVDPYGISKNIIVRQALASKQNIHILRLFGCACEDDEPHRFIRMAFQNIIDKVPITLNTNKKMDFFYIEDIATVINHIIINNLDPVHINLVYDKKYTLLELAKLMKKITNSPHQIINVKNENDTDYTGDGTKLKNMNLNLLGLEHGLKKIYYKLLCN